MKSPCACTIYTTWTLSRKGPKNTPTKSQEAEQDFVVRRGLREETISLEAWREAACPRTLLPKAAEAVAEAVRRGRRSALAPLPLFVEDVRTSRKDRAWLKSEDAAEWRR